MDTSLRLGGLFGFYVGPFVSLNGELSIDVLNLSSPGTGSSASGGLVGFTFSPLFHFALPQVDFVVGPRLGWYDMPVTISYNDGSPDDTYSESGFLYGLNAGAFFWVGRIAFGGLLSVSIHSPSSYCLNDVCGDVPSGFSSLKVVGLNGAMLF